MTTWQFNNFTRAEFACSCCDKSEIDVDFVAALQRIRDKFGKAMPITSGYRCPMHNASVSSTGLRGPHVTGKAADIAVMGEDALKVLRIALEDPAITGVGIAQRGAPATRFLHLDALDPGNYPRPTVWSY